MTESEEAIKARILKVLEIYPKLSPSMLHIGIGPQLKVSSWHPVLKQLITDGVIVQDELISLTSTDREQVYRVLSLAVRA